MIRQVPAFQWLILLGAAVILASPALADELWLRSGGKVEGIWQGESQGSIEMLFTDRTRKQYPISEVKSICFVNGVSESVARADSLQDEIVLASGGVAAGVFDRATTTTVHFTGSDRQKSSYRIDEIQCVRFRDPGLTSRRGGSANETADELRLRSGETVRGTLMQANTREVRFMNEEGQTGRYAMADVESIHIAVPVEAEEPELSGVLAPARQRRSTRTRQSDALTIPVDTLVTVRLIDAISVDETAVGEKYAASIDEPVVVEGQEVISHGADATVEVVEAEESGRFRGRSILSLRLHSVTVDGAFSETSTELATLSGKDETQDTAIKTGGGAAVGAIVGAIIGGGSGADAGAAVGGGAGEVVSSRDRGKLDIPSETRLEFRLRSPLVIN